MKIRPSTIFLSTFRIPNSAFRSLFIVSAILANCIFCFDAAQAESGPVVQPIEEAALDELVNNKNNILIVSFMAAWCEPCIDELPALNRLYRKYTAHGLRLIGISIDLEGAAAIQPIITRLKIEFPVYWYGEKAIAKYNLTAIPLLLIIRDGKVIERLPGRRSDAFLEKKINEFLK